MLQGFAIPDYGGERLEAGATAGHAQQVKPFIFIDYDQQGKERMVKTREL